MGKSRRQQLRSQQRELPAHPPNKRNLESPHGAASWERDGKSTTPMVIVRKLRQQSDAWPNSSNQMFGAVKPDKVRQQQLQAQLHATVSFEIHHAPNADVEAVLWNVDGTEPAPNWVTNSRWNSVSQRSPVLTCSLTDKLQLEEPLIKRVMSKSANGRVATTLANNK